nr:PREDICTED: cholinesterase 1-like [Bemisia tabaci]
MTILQKGSVLLVSTVIWSEIFVCLSSPSSPTVRTKNGWVIGTTTTTRMGRRVDAFRGIPFAKPPVGSLRFQDPEPAEAINGTFHATEDGPECVQRANNDLSQPLQVTGDEDCLRLNVYRPSVRYFFDGMKDDINSYYNTQTQSSTQTYSSQGENDEGDGGRAYSNLPVLVFIHGGGWTTGSDQMDLYGPHYLLDSRYDFILVIFNYRLDVFGFYCSGDKEAPGNFGLKDQVLALKWVKENIRDYGGDPNNVTIFGESVGGVSVHTLFFARSAQGLFQKGISISGTVAMPVAHLPVAFVNSATERLGERFNCPLENSSALLACMQEVPAYELIEQQLNTSPPGYPPFLVMTWVPVLDYNITADPFFLSNLTEMLSQPNFTWINGATTYDGSYFTGHIYGYPKFVEQIKANPERYLPQLLFLPQYIPEEDVPKCMARISDFYFGFPPQVTQKSLTILMTDAYFYQPVIQTSPLNGGPTYAYQYAFPYRHSTWNNVYGPRDVITEKPGHSDILLNFFETSKYFNRSTDTQTEVDVSERLVDLFTSFLIFEGPTQENVTWTTVGSEQNFTYEYLDKQFTERQNPYPDRTEFWRHLRSDFPGLY